VDEPFPAGRDSEVAGERIDERVKIEVAAIGCLQGGDWRQHGGAHNNGFR
jgi:hypothetical protein